jgi:hypothetical protein
MADLMDYLFGDDNELNFGENVDLNSDDDYKWFDTSSNEELWGDLDTYRPELDFEKDEPEWDWFTLDDDDFKIDDEIMDFDLSEFDDDDDEEGWLKKIPTSFWDKLIAGGMAGLGEWLKMKSEKPRKSGGGGGGRGPTDAVKTTVPVGTRTK